MQMRIAWPEDWTSLDLPATAPRDLILSKPPCFAHRARVCLVPARLQHAFNLLSSAKKILFNSPSLTGRTFAGYARFPCFVIIIRYLSLLGLAILPLQSWQRGSATLTDARQTPCIKRQS